MNNVLHTQSSPVLRAILRLSLWALAIVPSLGGKPLDWLPEGFPEANESMLCTRDYLTPEMGALVLDAASDAFDSREKWEEYKAHAKKRILEGAGLSPMPRREDLKPVSHSHRAYDGYSVENVAFESVPGFWVTGNLYRPSNPRGKAPAILNTHGHTGRIEKESDWVKHGRFHEQAQKRAAALAKMGAVVFSIDMFGYGDGIAQVGQDAHRSELTMRIQLWNCIRALDFLEALPEVDASRLGVTGESGGGTQAFFLTALDARIAASVPVAMVSSYFFGGCPCESGRPVHRSADHFVSNAMVAAMAAPRPMLLVSDGGDWTLNTPGVELPYLKKVYGLYGRPDQVGNVHLADEGHNYGPSKRAAMYPFFAEVFGLNLAKIKNAAGEIDESTLVVEDPALMRVFDERRVPPVWALRDAAAVSRALDRLQRDESLNVSAYDLRCDLMKSPLGVDSVSPRLSWRLEGEGRDSKQTAYQILVATAPDRLYPNSADLWNSGKVNSGEQSGIIYEGDELDDSQRVFWRVRVWNESNVAMPWSETSEWTMGTLGRDGWSGAKWIAHPQWLEVNRPHLGYRSLPAESVDTPKWLTMDLGEIVPIDEIRLHALRHTVAERLGFPTVFKIEIAQQEDFSDAYAVIDYTETPFANSWETLHEFALEQPRKGRYVRIFVPRLRELNGEICLAFSQIEVRSGEENVALGARVTASDSLEEGPWSAAAVVDGKGVPGSNPLGTKTVRLRKEFRVEGEVSRAVVHVTGLGHYSLHLNGERIGDDRLSPGWTDTTKTVLYDTRDVTSFIRKGGNAIGIQLASGMYSVAHPEKRYTKFVGRFRPLEAIVALRVEYRDGRVETVVSDGSWKAASGPITYSHVYGGEDYDARSEQDGWARAGFESENWVAAAVAPDPGGTLKGASFAAPVLRGHERLKPVEVVELGKGVFVYDFGQNAAMMPEIEAKGAAGAVLRMIPGELLRNDGTVYRGSSAHGGKSAYWQYTFSGKSKVERWKPEFFYHGARYLQVELEPAEVGGARPELLEIESVVTHSDSEPVGEFACSSALFNRIRQLIRWAQRSNLASVLTDCPHRERLGWLEQYHLNGPSLRYEFDLAQLYNKAFGDMADAQIESGLVPNIAPEFIAFEGAFRDSPEWGSAFILAAWQQYLWTGDKSAFERHYERMVAYLDYLASRADGGVLSHGLGDWYDLGPERPGFAQLTPIALTATATYYEDTQVMERIARLLGKESDAERFSAEAKAIREAFNAALFDYESGNYGEASQAGNAMAYVLGLVPESYEKSVVDAIVADIRSRGNAFSAGDVGHRYLLLALSKAGRSDVIFDMHHQSDRPGYGWQIEKGATSLTEAWDAGRHASQNHFMLGHLMEWFYADLVGIQPAATDPGFGKVIVKPQPIPEIQWAQASLESVRGRVAAGWRRRETWFELTVSLDPNMTAEVHVPVGDASIIFLDGKPLREVIGGEAIVAGKRAQLVTLGSGDWTLELK